MNAWIYIKLQWNDMINANFFVKKKVYELDDKWYQFIVNIKICMNVFMNKYIYIYICICVMMWMANLISDEFLNQLSMNCIK